MQAVDSHIFLWGMKQSNAHVRTLCAERITFAAKQISKHSNMTTTGEQYFEKQRYLLCGKHAINNLLGREMLCYDWANKNKAVCQKTGSAPLVNLAFYANRLTNDTMRILHNEDLSHGNEYGNVTIEAMMEAVKELTYDGRAFRLQVFTTSKKYKKTDRFQLQDLLNINQREHVVGFINGSRAHFKAIKVWHDQKDPKYQVIDSMSRKPGVQQNKLPLPTSSRITKHTSLLADLCLIQSYSSARMRCNPKSTLILKASSL